MPIPRFNRHENMSSETIAELMKILAELSYCEFPTHQLENMIYGFFDGYDYSENIIQSSQLSNVLQTNSALHKQICSICKVIKSYPKYQSETI